MRSSGEHKLSIKSFIKKLPFAVRVVRFIRAILQKILIILFQGMNKLTKRYSLFRGMFFRSKGEGDLLVANHGDELYVVDPKDKGVAYELYRYGFYGVDDIQAACKLIKAKCDDIVLINAGANMGSICIPAVSRGLVKQAVAIEPEPYNYRLLRTNIVLNGLEDKIKTLNTALGSRDNETLQMKIEQHSFGGHSVVNAHSPIAKNQKIIEIPSISADSVYKDYKSSTILLYLDVEGYELYALQGSRMIMQDRNPIVIEFNPIAMNQSNSYVQLKEMLSQSNYEVFFDLSEKNPQPVELSAKNIDDLHKTFYGDRQLTNILIQ